MNRYRIAWLAFATPSMLAMAHPAWAAMRPMPYSFPYETLEEGGRTLGFYSDDTGAGALENRLALAVGLTDHFSLTGYASFRQLSAVDALKVEGTYRFAEKGEWPVDTGILVDYAQPIDQAVAPSLAAKLLLEKSFGPLVLMSNLIAAQDLAPNLPGLGATLGASYAVTDRFEPGVEAILDAGRYLAGPTASGAIGPLELTGGVLFGAQNALVARLLVTQTF